MIHIIRLSSAKLPKLLENHKFYMKTIENVGVIFLPGYAEKRKDKSMPVFEKIGRKPL